MFPRLEFHTYDRLPSGVMRELPRVRRKNRERLSKWCRGVDSLMEFWFSFQEAMPRQRESPRATFPSTINTLLCRAVPMRGWRTRRAPAFTTKRPPARRFSVRSTLIEVSRARRTEAIDVPRVLSGKVRFISGVVSTGLEITPTDVGWFCPSARCVQGIAIAIDRSEKERCTSTERARHAPLRHASFPTKIRLPLLSFSTSATTSCVCSSAHGNHHPSAAWLGLL